MKALILNSGLGSRMMPLTATQPKCLTILPSVVPECSAAGGVYRGGETILGRQLRLLLERGIDNVVITTGYFEDELKAACKERIAGGMHIDFVRNNDYRTTNYIYSIYCARDILDDDILLMHGDLVFEPDVLDAVIASKTSVMATSTAVPLPEKDFKAVVKDGRITAVGVSFFDDAVAAQPLYKLLREDWRVWLGRITEFCEGGNTKCYAENAFNEVSDKCHIYPLDAGEMLCAEIDNMADYEAVCQSLGGGQSPNMGTQ